MGGQIDHLGLNLLGMDIDIPPANPSPPANPRSGGYARLLLRSGRCVTQLGVAWTCLLMMVLRTTPLDPSEAAVSESIQVALRHFTLKIYLRTGPCCD